MKITEKKIELGGRELKLSTGLLAEQASGAVLATYGETVVLATVVGSRLEKDLGYFPLTVDYQERLYAGGRIKGSRWVKREGKPTDEEILSGRLIDRSLRPLFPKGYKKDVQVIVMVLSHDLENDPSILGSVAASAAVAISHLPWKGPVGIVKVGRKDGKYFVNPKATDMEASDMDLTVSATDDAVLMVEAGIKEVDEKGVLDGIKFGFEEAQKVITLINDLAKAAGAKKEDFEEVKPPAKLVTEVKKLAKEKIAEIVMGKAQHEGGIGEFDELIAGISDRFEGDDLKFIPEIVHNMEKDFVREMVLKGKRVDGRKLTEVRELSAWVSVLPRTHGSAIFKRGQSQVLTVTTLGAPSLSQLIESAGGEEERRYMHHYSMPPYATGETGRVGSPNRREIGHGALAERALMPVIPTEEVFPYAIRLVSEVVSSNGSTSMASVCGSTLSLMDAGVPITAPVSGIAMGLVIEDDKKYSVMSDIAGIEDFDGDMDFKVAGTTKGITALQLDVKTLKLTPAILEVALAQSKEGRAHILKFMLDTLKEARATVSLHAPKIKSVKIPVEKIGELIGPGGKTIKKIIAETGAQVDVDDDGTVIVSAASTEAMEKGIKTVTDITKDPIAGEIYDGIVKRIQNFGAFVQILPGKEGLVHVSDMSTDFVKDPNDIVKMGDTVKVRVKGIDELGRLNLSMVMDPAFDQQKEERRRDNFRGEGGNDRYRNEGGNDRGRRRFDDRRGGRRDFNRGQGQGGPHFPTSRLLQDTKGRR